MRHSTPNNWSPLRLQSGFTLMELMVALLLTVFLIGGSLAVFLSGKLTFLDSGQLSRIQENVRFASDYMIRDVRNAGFRDETFLRYGHEAQIIDGYARIIDDEDSTTDMPALRVRYAGRGNCTEAFDEFRLVENEYTVDANGQLTCRGRSVSRDVAGSVQIADQDWEDPIGLVTGVTGITFQPICPADDSTCTCDEIASTCIGVDVALQFQGMRAQDTDRDFEPRSIELTAAFRNIILDRFNEAAWGTTEDEEET